MRRGGGGGLAAQLDDGGALWLRIAYHTTTVVLSLAAIKERFFLNMGATRDNLMIWRNPAPRSGGMNPLISS